MLPKMLKIYGGCSQYIHELPRRKALRRNLDMLDPLAQVVFPARMFGLEEVMELVLSEIVSLLGVISVFVAICSLEGTP